MNYGKIFDKVKFFSDLSQKKRIYYVFQPNGSYFYIIHGVGIELNIVVGLIYKSTTETFIIINLGRKLEIKIKKAHNTIYK